MLELKTVDTVPKPQTGSTKNSEERIAIQEALQANIGTDKGTLIEGIEAGKPAVNLSQRIRKAGEQIGVKVTVVFQKSDDGKTVDLYFKPSTKPERKAKTEDKPVTKKAAK